jgi:hypothetical protein
MFFRKKPVVIEAFKLGTDAMPDWFSDAITTMKVITYPNKQDHCNPFEPNLSHAAITTLEGIHRADLGDFIIKGVKGELYPCKPDIFEMTYEIVEK